MSQIPLMPEVGDPHLRRVHDFYPTPAWMTHALCRRMSLHRVLEPCVGMGDIVRALWAPDGSYTPEVVCTNDINPDFAADHHLDATLPETWPVLCDYPRPICVVTNPPFNLADAIVPLAVQHAPAVAMLLRLSWLEPTLARQEFLKAHPPSRLIVMPRHDFRGDGSTDSVTSAWFIWHRNGLARHQIEIVTKDERDELIALHGGER